MRFVRAAHGRRVVTLPPLGRLGDVFTPTAEALAASSTPPAVLAWMTSVRNRGGVVTRLKGKLVARFGTTTPFVYEPASLAAQAADTGRAVVDQVRVAGVGVLDAAQTGARAVFDAPAAVVGRVLGLPTNAAKLLLLAGVIAGGVYMVKRARGR